MIKRTDPNEWAEEFKAFLGAPEVKPPRHMQDEIFRIVRKDLNPSLWSVLAKLAGIHFFAGSLSLLFCTQFGIGRGYEVAHLFMNYGDLACMAVCGSFFLCLTVGMAGFILSMEELKKIRKTFYAPIVLLGAASLIVFFFFGARIVFNLALFWLAGAMLAGTLLTETSLFIRGKILQVGQP